MSTFAILCGNSVIFGMTEDGLIKEVRYLLRAGHTSMEIMTDDEWRAREERDNPPQYKVALLADEDMRNENEVKKEERNDR